MFLIKFDLFDLMRQKSPLASARKQKIDRQINELLKKTLSATLIGSVEYKDPD
jgi:hypothetical protein